MSELPPVDVGWAPADEYAPRRTSVPRPNVGGTFGPRGAFRTSSTFAFAGFVIAVVATALVASVPGSPFHPVLPPGVDPGGPFRWLADAVGFGELRGSALVTASVAAVIASRWRSSSAARGVARHVSLRTAVIAGGGRSRRRPDASAADLARRLLLHRLRTIAGIHHANPYIRTPVDFPHDAVWILVGPKWFATPAVYGPLFTGFASLVVRLVDSLAAQVEAFRWTSPCASLGTIALIATTVGGCGRPVPRSRSPRSGEPVVLFQSVASGHNDLLVALAVAGAFALGAGAAGAARRRRAHAGHARQGRRRAPAPAAGGLVRRARARPAAASARSSPMRGSPP